jgi:hypothetical protein
MYHYGSEKLATTSTGIEIKGANANNKISSYFSGSYTSGFKFSDLNGGIWYDAGADDLTVSAGHANSQLILEAGGAEAMRLTSAGNVGIATSNPTVPLHVNGTIRGNILSVQSELFLGSSSMGKLSQSGSNWVFDTYASGAFGERFRISDTGVDVTGTVTADAGSYTTVIGGNSITFDRNGDNNIIADSGTSANLTLTAGNRIVSSADSYHAFKTGSTPTERMRINSSGNVNIGSTNSGVGGSIDLSVGNTSSTGGITLWSPTNGTHSLGFGDGYTGTDRYRGYVEYSHSDDSMRLATGSTERMRLDSSGNLLFNGNGVVSVQSNSSNFYLGGGSYSPSELHLESGALTAFKVNGSERMRIDSSGNLLVGQTSNAETGTGIGLVSDGTSHMYSGGTDTLMLGRGGSDGDILSFNKSGTTVGSIFNSGTTMGVGSLDTGVLLANNIDAILPWNASTNAERDNAIDLGRSSGRFKDLYLSGGVHLGGTGSANKLDDYEEGTFTPTVAGTTTAGSASYSIQQGRYTKIGRLVYYSIRIGYSSHTGAGNMRINGLPFTSDSFYSAGEYSYRDGLTVPSNEDLKVYVPPSQSYVGLYAVALGTDAVAALALDTAVTDLSVSGVYHV